MVSQSWKQNRGWWKPIPLTRLGFTESISCHTALIVGHAMSNGHGSDPIDQSLRAEWLMMVDRTVGRVGFVLQFALGIYMNLSYPGCLEARDAPAVRPSTICPAEERFGCLQGAAMGWKHGM